MEHVIHKFSDDGRIKTLAIRHLMAGDDHWDISIDNYFQGTLLYQDGRWVIYNDRFSSDEINFMVELLLEKDSNFVNKCLNRWAERDRQIFEHREFLRKYRGNC